MCPIRYNTLSNALHKDSDIRGLNLNRSNSLRDLNELVQMRKSVRVENKILFSPLKRRYCSCPDLREIQFLCNILPQVYEILMCTGYQDIYYRHKRQRHRQICPTFRVHAI